MGYLRVTGVHLPSGVTTSTAVCLSGESALNLKHFKVFFKISAKKEKVVTLSLGISQLAGISKLSRKKTEE